MRGFRKKTDEEIASEELYDFFMGQRNAIVHCWHPPDGKAYFTQLLQIPQVTSEGLRTGKRDHIDLIVQIEKSLLLLEVKGSSSDIQIDVVKLTNIYNAFNIDQILHVFEQQGAKFIVKPDNLILGLAVRLGDTTDIPNFAIFQADIGKVIAVNKLASDLMSVLKKSDCL